MASLAWLSDGLGEVKLPVGQVDFFAKVLLNHTHLYWEKATILEVGCSEKWKQSPNHRKGCITCCMPTFRNVSSHPTCWTHAGRLETMQTFVEQKLLPFWNIYNLQGTQVFHIIQRQRQENKKNTTAPEASPHTCGWLAGEWWWPQQNIWSLLSYQRAGLLSATC